MKKKETLEDFIKTYIRNVKISSSPESYSEWIKSYGIDSSGTLDKSLKDISSDYEKAKSSFGANAEGLASLGKIFECVKACTRRGEKYDVALFRYFGSDLYTLGKV